MLPKKSTCAVALAVAALCTGRASGRECRTAHFTCWSHMPVAGFCECTVHKQTEDGVVISKKASAWRGNSASAVPYGASTETYLQIAQRAVSAGDKMRADIALGRAETSLLTNSYIAGSITGPISSPAIDIIRKARAAVMVADYSDASRLIAKAMQGPEIKQNVGTNISPTQGEGHSTNNGSVK